MYRCLNILHPQSFQYEVDKDSMWHNCSFYLVAGLQLFLGLQGHSLIDDVSGKQNTSFVILSTFLHNNETGQREGYAQI